MPEEVEMEQAALSEPLSCLAHGWDRMNPIHVGQRVLVLGAGIIGLLWSSILHLHGLRKTVTVSEPQEKRREAVKKMGKILIFRRISESLKRETNKVGLAGLEYQVSNPSELKGNEYDVVVDCSGSGPAMESAIPLLARGGRFCIFGVADPKVNIKINPYDVSNSTRSSTRLLIYQLGTLVSTVLIACFQMYKKELTIYGVNINPFTFSRGIGLLKAMASSYIQYDNLGIKVFKLSEYNEALEALKKGIISKAVFKL